MKKILKLSSACLLLLSLFACANQSQFTMQSKRNELGIKFIASNKSSASDFKIGSSTLSEVEAALGLSRKVRFENGYELLIYQYASTAEGEAKRLSKERSKQHFLAPLIIDHGGLIKGNSELLFLFKPSGVLTKMRTNSAGSNYVEQG